MCNKTNNIESYKFSSIVKGYCEILKTKKSLGAYSNPKNEIGNLVKLETTFLDITEPSMKHRVCYILNDMYEIIKCPICDNYGKLNIEKDFSYNIKGCSVECSTIIYKTFKNPITGLTNYQTRNMKGANTKRNTIVDGNNIFKNSGIKGSKTLNTINEDGKSIADIRGLNYSKNIKVIQDNGLSRAQEIANNAAITMMNTIDSDTGLSIAKSIGLKVSEAKLKIMDDGRTKGQHDREKSQISIGLKIYNERKSVIISKGFTLLTSSLEYLSSRLLKYSCNECDSIRESYWPYIRCIKCYPYNRSIGENEVLEFCQSLTSEVQSNLRSIIPPLELDIYIPCHNLAIEYDGVFWHSSDSVETENKDYHLYKTEQCKSQDIQLFHIFENEWLDPQKQKIWKSIIRNKLGFSDRIFARKTEVTKITSKDTKEFLNGNHLQGTCTSSVNLGLKYDDELVAIMTFGRSRYDKGVEWELLRYCSRLGTSVVGGASKLLKAFQRSNSGSIISYADKRRSNGNLYEKLGFELSHESAPNYWYYKDFMKLESRIECQKHKLRDKLEIFNDKLTESENMYMNGYRKIFDCGNQVWKLK